LCSAFEQDFAEAIAIIKGLKRIRGVRIEINAALFGVEWAATAAKKRYYGVIDRWANAADKNALYVKWEGVARNQLTPLENMDKDTENNTLGLTIIDYADGRAAPTMDDIEDESDGDEEGINSSPNGDGSSAGEEGEGEESETEKAPDEIEIGGTKWKLRAPNAIRTDERKDPRNKMSLNKGDIDVGTIDKIFDFLTPDGWFESMMRYTNPKLLGSTLIDAKLTVGELKQWWGYALAASIHTGTSLDGLWSPLPKPESILPPPSFGQHGMSLNRFKKIRSVLTFGPADAATLEKDPWAFVRPLVDMFNECRADKVHPSWLLTMDESMIAWRGREGVGDPMKCPAISFVPRKPEPLGVELKTTADAMGGVMLRIEICEGKSRHDKQKFFNDTYRDKAPAQKNNVGHCTATSLRIVEPWFGTNRVVAGDSWFASKKLAHLMRSVGLHFIGDVKTNSAQYPKKEITLATGDQQGDWAVYTAKLPALGSSTEPIPIYAVSARRGPSAHCFISTCGTTLPGNAQPIYEAGEDDDAPETLNVEDVALNRFKRRCPRILNDYTQAQPAIDRCVPPVVCSVLPAIRFAPAPAPLSLPCARRHTPSPGARSLTHLRLPASQAQPVPPAYARHGEAPAHEHVLDALRHLHPRYDIRRRFLRAQVHERPIGRLQARHGAPCLQADAQPGGARAQPQRDASGRVSRQAQVLRLTII